MELLVKLSDTTDPTSNLKLEALLPLCLIKAPMQTGASAACKLPVPLKKAPSLKSVAAIENDCVVLVGLVAVPNVELVPS